MVRLSDEVRREALRKLMNLCYLRGEGTTSEDEIAEQLGFRDGMGGHSAEIMYERLKDWELPDWLVYPDGASRETHTKKERQARAGEGEVIELPPASGAVPMFRETLERLLADVDELPNRMEYLKDRRFVVERDTQGDFIAGEVTARLWRKDYSDEEWRRWCEQRGEDPEAEFVDVPMEKLRALRSASTIPPKPLDALIPIYVLAGGDPDRLLDVLQPDRPRARREQLGEIERRLRKEARRYATGARGGDVKTGRTPPPLTAEEHTAAIYIKERREQGASDEQILQELHRLPLYSTLRFDLDEVQRLVNFRLD